jgi:hypothetical protein
MNLTEAAKTLGVSPRTLRLAVERGEIEAEHPLDDGPWILRLISRVYPAQSLGIWAGTRANHNALRTAWKTVN